MRTLKHSVTAAEQAIHRLIEGLLNLFTICKARNEELAKLKEQVQQLDDNNPDFHEMLEDRRENNKMTWRLIIIALSIAVDFFLLYHAMTILCEQFGLPGFLKFAVPAFLIIVEIGVSYFSFIQQRSGERGSWLSRNLQYFVLFILVGLSVLVIVYSIQGYNAAIDGISFSSFLTGTIVLQVALLISSVMLHIWLIKNSEAIAETFAYLQYKSDRKKLTNKIEKLEKENRKKYHPEFTKRTHHLVQNVESFKRHNPEANACFENTMPSELIRGINAVMGRNYFIPPAENAA